MSRPTSGATVEAIGPLVSLTAACRNTGNVLGGVTGTIPASGRSIATVTLPPGS